MRHHLYRLQQKLSITAPEAFALLVLAALFMLGLGVRYWKSAHPPDFSEAYAAIDSLVAEGTSRLHADLATASLDSSGIGQMPMFVGSDLIDLNRATATELQRLPRVGPAIAGRILEYRAAHGPFTSVDELTGVRGIGPKTLESLKPLIHIAKDSL